MTGDVPEVAYFHGDDGWSMAHEVDAIARRIERTTGAAPDRQRLTGKDVTVEAITGPVTTAPMFGGGTMLVATDPPPLTRSKESRAAVERLLKNVAPGNALVFIEQRVGGRKRTASAEDLAKLVGIAGGTVKAFPMPMGSSLVGWLNTRAAELDMTLEPAAARDLAERLGGLVTEGDVDRSTLGPLAVNELRKLSLYRLDGPVTVDDVRALVPAAVPDSAWAFLDAVALRRIAHVAPQLDRLLETQPEPVILVQLHRRLRSLLIAADHIAAGGTPAGLLKLLGGSPFVADKTAQQSRAWTVTELEAALDGLLELDATLKGIGATGQTDAQRRMAWITWAATCVAPSPRGPQTLNRDRH
jgi:DNA polymerase III delta subunit